MEDKIAQLHPDIQGPCRMLMARLRLAGIDARLGFTYRTPEIQDGLYAQGRTKPGKIVTNLRGSQSKHCFTLNGKPASKAFDIIICKDGKYITDGSHPLYTQAGEMGEALGLSWGGRWKRPFDPSHFEIP